MYSRGAMGCQAMMSSRNRRFSLVEQVANGWAICMTGVVLLACAALALLFG